MDELPQAILWPVAGHLLLVLFLFVMVSLKRMQSVKSGVIKINDLADKQMEPETSRRWVNNLNNQFEIPMLFYIAVLFLFVTESVTSLQVALAWIFLAGRILHTAVQVSGDNVRLRGQVFTVNFLAVAAMWAIFLMTQGGFL